MNSTTPRRTVKALGAALVGLFLAGSVGVLAAPASPAAHRGHVAGPNFACVAVYNDGICIGPPF